MSTSLPDTPPSWIDPDDAPELTDEFFEKGVWRIGECVVLPQDGVAAFKQAARRGRPAGSTKPSAKQAVTVRYSPEVLAARSRPQEPVGKHA